MLIYLAFVNYDQWCDKFEELMKVYVINVMSISGKQRLQRMNNGENTIERKGEKLKSTDIWEYTNRRWIHKMQIKTKITMAKHFQTSFYWPRRVRFFIRLYYDSVIQQRQFVNYIIMSFWYTTQNSTFIYFFKK